MSESIKELVKLVNKIEVKEVDYFKKNNICYLGTTKPYEYYDEEDFPTLEHNFNDLAGWKIDENEFFNTDVIASAGAGKGKLTKNIIAQYHKQGWRVIVFSPKEDEFSVAKKKGINQRLHPLTKPESLPISSYIPSYIKYWRIKNDYSNAKYKVFSPTITDFDDSDTWQTFGMSYQSSQFCASQIKKGVSSLKELNEEIDKNPKLFISSKNSMKNIIDYMIGNKLIDEKIPKLDLNEEWGFSERFKGVSKEYRPNNIVVINLFSHPNKSYMGNLIHSTLQQVKNTIQKARSRRFKERVLVVCDDAYYYSAKNEPAHYNSISSIIQMKTAWRKIGVDNLVLYQFLDLVHGDIYRSTKDFILSYVPDASSLRAIIPPDAYYFLVNELEFRQPFHVQWIYVFQNTKFLTFYANNPVCGHDFT